ncbi:MAG: hypothetical protein Q8T13_21415 [Acidobacteriota bacterium]|nr:hypothetical protein [Acidobacteriota bacterium]
MKDAASDWHKSQLCEGVDINCNRSPDVLNVNAHGQANDVLDALKPARNSRRDLDPRAISERQLPLESVVLPTNLVKRLPSESKAEPQADQATKGEERLQQIREVARPERLTEVGRGVGAAQPTERMHEGRL